MRLTRSAPWKALLLPAVCLFALGAAQSSARAQEPLMIGSPNTAMADPPVPTPNTTPVSVPLFSGVQFDDFNARTFSYTPPSGGPWAKIVLVGDFSINAGVQYDRTCQISIGYANIYFGTTPEPSGTFGPSWHFERDVTDYSSLLKSAQPGEADLGNLVNSTYTGVITGNCKLLFYPASRAYPAAVTPDLVYPFPDGPGGAAGLGSPTSTLSETITFPTNVTRAYLDLITQSQGNDEFWWTDVPSDLSSELEDTGGTAFREGEVMVDDIPAGVAPVYPWIYTGGIDPFLWAPIPGVQTINFTPYRVDLTPFAGLLNDGQPHQVSISIYNDNNYFSVAGSLFVYRDPVMQTVPGMLSHDTIVSGPQPLIYSNIVTAPSGNITGPVEIESYRRFTIEGFIDGSQGHVDTAVEQQIGFTNQQHFTLTASEYAQQILQDTKIYSTTITTTSQGVAKKMLDFDYPLIFDYDELVPAAGNITVKSTVNQAYRLNEMDSMNGQTAFMSSLFDGVTPTDTLVFDSAGNFVGNTNQSSAQSYVYSDSAGNSYSKSITAANGVLTSIH